MLSFCSGRFGLWACGFRVLLGQDDIPSSPGPSIRVEEAVVVAVVVVLLAAVQER